MTGFRVDRTPPLGVEEAWRRLTDWPAHAAQVPLTRISVRPDGPTREGTIVIARTAVGSVGFDDPMEVVVWRPSVAGGPGRCRLEKRGRVVLGWAEIEVRAEAGVTRVTWREDLRVGVLPRFFDGVTSTVGQLVFGRAVDRLLGIPPN